MLKSHTDLGSAVVEKSNMCKGPAHYNAWTRADPGASSLGVFLCEQPVSSQGNVAQGIVVSPQLGTDGRK